MECHVWVFNVAYLEIALGSFTRISFVRNWAAWEGFNAVIDMPFVLLGLASLGNKNMECDPKRGGENVIMLLTKRHIYVHIIYLHIYIYILDLPSNPGCQSQMKVLPERLGEGRFLGAVSLSSMT